MLTTKRYDYVPFVSIKEHPMIVNHRPLNLEKVRHYAEDILRNGLLEPLLVWERNGGEYFLVGGFHRLNAIRTIREQHPNYFDRVDVRVVTGDLEEMRALNLKLNADRLDVSVSEYFDTIIFLNNANWDKQRISDFLDKSVSYIEEIIRYVPGMDPRLRKMLDEGKTSWAKVKEACRASMQAEPGTERTVVDKALSELSNPNATPKVAKPLTVKKATMQLGKFMKKNPKAQYSVSAQELYALLLVLGGKKFEADHVTLVRSKFPGLLD